MNQDPATTAIKPPLVLFTKLLKRNDLGKTSGYKYLNAGLIETVLIGRKRYARANALDDLPEKLAALAEKEGA